MFILVWSPQSLSSTEAVKMPTKFSLKHFTKQYKYAYLKQKYCLDLTWTKREGRGREQHRTNRQSRNESGHNNDSQQADDNLALTFLRHLQSRFKP